MNPYLLLLLMMQAQQSRGQPGLSGAVGRFGLQKLLGGSGLAGKTALGGANSVAGLSGISGASVTGGAQGAGLGGAGAGAGSLAAMWPAAAVAAVPMIGKMLNDGGNRKYQEGALRDFASGNAQSMPLDLMMTQRGGATFLGGDPNQIDRALEGGMGYRINPMLMSIRANPENAKSYLSRVSQTPDRYKGAENRAATRAADNAVSKGYNVTPKTVQNNIGGVRHAFRPENIEYRRTQGGR